MYIILYIYICICIYTSAEGWGAFGVKMMREGAELLILLALLVQSTNTDGSAEYAKFGAP
jgi:hypothetical protein